MAERGGANVKVKITADDSGLQRGLHGAEGDLRRFGDRGGKSLHALRTGAIAAGAALTTGVVVGLKQSFDAAVEAEKSQGRLKAQLDALGISYKAHAQQIDNVIQKTSKLAGIDDEDLQDAFTKIVRSTGSVNTGLKDMAVVSDLARAGHMEVGRAADIVSKAHAGSFVALKKYIGVVQPVTKAQDALKNSTTKATTEQVAAAKAADKSATAQKALGVLQDRLKGQAEAYGKTAAGAQDRFRVAMENLKETVGAKLLPVVTKVATKAADFVQQMVDGKGAGGRFADALKNVYGRVKPIVEFFVKHPQYIAVAVSAWAAYRTAAAAATTFTRLKLIGQFAGLVAPAEAAGAKAGGSWLAAFKRSGPLLVAGIIADALIDAEPADLDPAKERAQLDAIHKRSKGYGEMSDYASKLNKNTLAAVKAIGAVGDMSQSVKSKMDTGTSSFKRSGDSAKTASRYTDLLKKSMEGISSGNWKVKMDVSQVIRNVRDANLAIDRMISKLQQAGVLQGQVGNGGGGGGGGGGSTVTPGNGNAKAKISSVRRRPPVLGITFEEVKAIFAPNKQARGDDIRDALSLIDAKEAAGVMGAGIAEARRGMIATKAAGGAYGALSQRDRLEFLAAKRTSVKAQKDRRQAKNQKTQHAAFTKYTASMTLIDEKEAAGELTPEQADQLRLATIDQFLNGTGIFKGLGKGTAHERRLVKADLQNIRGEQASAAAAVTGSTDTGVAGTDDGSDSLSETNALLQQQLDLMKQARDEYQRALNVSQSQYDTFKRVFADIVSGELGGRMGLGFQSPAFASGMARY